jgi:hypothetical protein
MITLHGVLSTPLCRRNLSHIDVRGHRAAVTFAYVPAAVATYSTQDFGLESQR